MSKKRSLLDSITDRLTNILKRKESTDYYLKIRKKAKYGKGLTKYWAQYKHHRIMRENGCSIPFCKQIFSEEGNPVFPHGLNGILISQGANIGKNCVIFHQVTIGSNTIAGSKNYGCPTIGDNVYIGCGAKIIGGVHIGNNARIGANCVVTQDIPDNCTVVMQKPRVIIHEEGTMNNAFVNYYDAFTSGKK